MTRHRYLCGCAAIVLLAFLVREWFVLAAVIPQPNQGDVGAYLRYAMHLVMDGTFSQAGDIHPPAPDAYRGPGYPLLLAGLYKLAGEARWFVAAYQAQVVLGTATVALTLALAREYMPRGLSLLAGLMIAMQPHHVAATGALLTEVMFGTCIAAALLLTALAWRKKSLGFALGAGVVYGFGYLVNPVIALFPFVLLPFLGRKHGTALLLASLVFVGGWSLRNTVQHASSDGRAVENFVQGSWPGYHHATHWWMWWPEDKAVLDGIRAETALLKQDKMAGLERIGRRLASDPLHYARWYALEKPFLLWSWDIRMGAGGVYQIGVADSPLEHPPLEWAVILQWALNPVLFGLMIAGAWWLRRSPVALFALYITAVHVVFQAEPRYAIPYRSAEAILAVAGFALALSGVRERARGWRVAGDGVGGDALLDAELVDVAAMPIKRRIVRADHERSG